MGRDQPRLPPLVIGGVDDMQDVAIGEAQALAGQTAVPGPVIVKQGSAATEGGGEDGERDTCTRWVSVTLQYLFLRHNGVSRALLLAHSFRRHRVVLVWPARQVGLEDP